MKDRIEWVDVFKALVIILVVMGHTPFAFNLIIYTFHMAAFFLISGYTLDFAKIPFKAYLFNQSKRLIIPYLSINILFYLLKFIFSIFAYYMYYYAENPSISQLISFIKNISSVDLAGATWYLVVLFEAPILAKLLFDILQKLKICTYGFPIVAFISLLYACYLYSNQHYLSYLFDLSLSALFLIVAGYIFKQHSVFSKINHHYALPVCLTTLYLLSFIKFSGINWPTRIFSSPVSIILASFSGIVVFYLVSLDISKVKILKSAFLYIGNKCWRFCFSTLAFLDFFIPSRFSLVGSNFHNYTNWF